MVDESAVWSGTPSQVTNMWTFLWCSACFFLVLPLFWMLWKFLVVRNTKYELTSQRLTTHVGVLSKTTEELELYRVKDTRFEQSLFLRIFGLGNVTLVSSDASSPIVKIKAVKNARALREQIRNLVEARRDAKQVRISELE